MFVILLVMTGLPVGGVTPETCELKHGSLG